MTETPVAQEQGGDDDLLRTALVMALAVVPMVGWVVYVIGAALTTHGENAPADVNSTLVGIGVACGTALAVIAGEFLGIKNEQDLGYATALKHRWPSLSIAGWATIAYFAGIVVGVVAFALDGDRNNAAEVIKTSLWTLLGFGIGAIKALTASD